MKREKMITLVQQERCNGDLMSTSVLKNSRVSNPAIFSKNFASGSILSISQKLFDTVYFTLPLGIVKVNQQIIAILILHPITTKFALF